MRCPSCGTDNAPDSRFCGGCGARFAASDPRVAPTHKISDDARFPERRLTPAAAPVTAPGVAMPRAIPPTPYVPHGAAPVAPGLQPQRAVGGSPAAPARPASAPPPQRPGGVAPGAFAATGPGAHALARPSPPPPPDALPIDDSPRSLPIPARRPWRLIVAVLLIDLGMAAAGAWMLSQGLGDLPGGAARSESSPPRSR